MRKIKIEYIICWGFFALFVYCTAKAAQQDVPPLSFLCFFVALFCLVVPFYMDYTERRNDRILEEWESLNKPENRVKDYMQEILAERAKRQEQRRSELAAQLADPSTMTPDHPDYMRMVVHGMD